MRRRDDNPPLDWLRNVALDWDRDECLLWPFGVDRDGYGRVKDHGYETRAHRMIFKLKYGRWPNPCALHSCDVPRCCNLRHIMEGSNVENQHQKAQRGRSVRGVYQHSAKLSEVDVRKIRALYVPNQYGLTKAIAERFGVTVRVIRLIARRKLWSHV